MRKIENKYKPLAFNKCYLLLFIFIYPGIMVTLSDIICPKYSINFNSVCIIWLLLKILIFTVSYKHIKGTIISTIEYVKECTAKNEETKLEYTKAEELIDSYLLCSFVSSIILITQLI